jgi:hypothetical protein
MDLFIGELEDQVSIMQVVRDDALMLEITVASIPSYAELELRIRYHYHLLTT